MTVWNVPITSYRRYSTGFGFPIVRWSRKPHPSQMRLARLQSFAWKSGKLLERRLGRVFCTVCNHFVTFKISGVWLGTLRGRPPSNGANWRRQVSHGWRKNWSGWNRTNQAGDYGPAVFRHWRRPLLDAVQYAATFVSVTSIATLFRFVCKPFVRH